MAPKTGMTQAQKLEKFLTYFHESATCHTLKDLEKSIPAATKVNKMQVKDLLQELTDTNQVKVEKIGSGNWYWAWAGEEATEMRNTVAKLELEQQTLNESISKTRSALDQLKLEQSAMQANIECREVISQLGPLENEIKFLVIEKDRWEEAVGGGVEQKMDGITRLKAEAEQATNNVYILEDSLRKLAGLNAEDMNQLRMRCYENAFVEGQGLPDIDELEGEQEVA